MYIISKWIYTVTLQPWRQNSHPTDPSEGPHKWKYMALT